MRYLILTLLLTTQAHACQFSTDCEPGSTCVKQGFNIYGSCTGGLNPGNNSDRQPVRYFNAPKAGNTCQFDTDCDIGHHCSKSDFSVRGVCE